MNDCGCHSKQILFIESGGRPWFAHSHFRDHSKSLDLYHFSHTKVTIILTCLIYSFIILSLEWQLPEGILSSMSRNKDLNGAKGWLSEIGGGLLKWGWVQEPCHQLKTYRKEKTKVYHGTIKYVMSVPSCQKGYCSISVPSKGRIVKTHLLWQSLYKTFPNPPRILSISISFFSAFLLGTYKTI